MNGDARETLVFQVLEGAFGRFRISRDQNLENEFDNAENPHIARDEMRMQIPT